MTKRQSQILGFISSFTKKNSYAPSLREIADKIGVSALSTVHKHLVGMEERGHISRQWNYSRSASIPSSTEFGAAVRERARIVRLITTHWPNTSIKKYESLMESIERGA